jgi:DNA-directed RNA polymerase specialized sigma subunit
MPNHPPPHQLENPIPGKKKRKKELPMIDNYHYSHANNITPVISNLYVKQLMKTIPSETGRYIIERVILQGYTESEVANELKITQQAVNKCKNKYLRILRNHLNGLPVC